MGIAWKMGFPPKIDSPNTEFGPDLSPPALVKVSAREAEQAAANGESLRLGDVVRRKRGAAPATVTNDEGDAEVRMPLIGHLSLPRQLRILLMIFGVGILITILALWRNSVSGGDASAQTQIASDALMHSQRIGKAAPNAIRGSPEAFVQLGDSRVQLNADLNLLQRGGEFAGSTIPAPPAGMNRALNTTRTKWVITDNAAATIMSGSP